MRLTAGWEIRLCVTFLVTNSETGKEKLTKEGEIHTFWESVQGLRSWLCIGANRNLILNSKERGFYPMSVPHRIPR